MNRYPEEKSVLVMDNAAIHHDPELVANLTAAGCRVEFLPAYSPDFNPIEEAFSTIKLWLRRHNAIFEDLDDPTYSLLLACAQIDGEKARGYYRHARYIMND
jgi:transposase